jgi:ADP-heptose:LPS heptosyltransferase
MREILVIRFSSLGDLCLLGAALARRADRSEAPQRVTLVTKAAFAPLMRMMRGVHEVLELRDSGAGELGRLAGEIQSRRWDEVIDAHGTLRSALLLARCGLRPDARIAKDTAARLALLRWRLASRQLERTMSDRFDDLFGQAGSGVETRPALRTDAAGGELRLGIAPGAQWPASSGRRIASPRCSTRSPRPPAHRLPCFWAHGKRAGTPAAPSNARWPRTGTAR